MKAEAQRIAIAQACGWRYHNDGDYVWLILPNGSKRLGHGDRAHKEYWECDIESLPDYLNDLNAMHAAEGVLSEDQWRSWEHVAATLSFPRGSTPLAIWIARMTAAQRAEAFLRTLNLWTESQ